MIDPEDFRRELETAVSTGSTDSPIAIETVVRRGRAARRRRNALRAGGASTAAVLLAGVALGVPALASGSAPGSAAAGGAATVAPSPTTTAGRVLVTPSRPPSPEPSSPVASIPGEPVPSPPVPGMTTCTPGPVKDITDRHARLASMCLPSELPRWSYRRNPDRPSRGGSTFFLSDGPQTYYQLGKPGGSYSVSGGGGSVTMQAFASTTPVLAGTGNFNPGPGGRIGPDRGSGSLYFIAYTTVLGVRATEVHYRGSPGIGILVHVDNLSIEAYAEGTKARPATYAQLIGVMDALRWHRADGR